MAVYLPATGFMLWPFRGLHVLHVVLTLFFLRRHPASFLCALMAPASGGTKRMPAELPADQAAGLYSADRLHDEAEMVPAIVSRISALTLAQELA
jgi:hypothetical protein